MKLATESIESTEFSPFFLGVLCVLCVLCGLPCFFLDERKTLPFARGQVPGEQQSPF